MFTVPYRHPLGGLYIIVSKPTLLLSTPRGRKGMGECSNITGCLPHMLKYMDPFLGMSLVSLEIAVYLYYLVSNTVTLDKSQLRQLSF